ncbi:formimidoylglutamate deiminase [Roseiterribacter gracilis]|uniref:Formimidoylglutamate deiminase n=1 Tax=Roseiterribacter gracilis TaxID=2812848 RepID=A0A8S8X8V2_9PROT|nr:formimidoylglutamate deiminase [Rhodospirillales bacterium TMPK1]
MNLTFSAARLADGWASNVGIATDANGQIESIKRATTGGKLVAIPAATNLHSHAFQRAMAGLAERQNARLDDFWSWRDAMYRFLDRMNPDQIEAIAAQLYVELLEAGYAHVCEFHYVWNDPHGRPYADPTITARAIRNAAARTGIGLSLVPVLYSHGNFGAKPPEHGQRRFLHSVDSFLSVVDELHPEAIALHSLRAVSAAQLHEVVAATDLPLHIHVAEQQREVDDCLAWSGLRPVEWLQRNVDLSSRWTLVHATHMTQDEAIETARSGAVVALCPSTEGNLGDGFFPAEAYLAAGGRFGIGSDSHVSTSPVEELRWFEYGRRLRNEKRALSAGEGSSQVGAFLWTRAAACSAASANAPLGEIAVGKRANLVLLDPDHPTLVGRDGDTLLDSFVFSGNGGAVAEVWVEGKRVVEQGSHVARDDIAANYRRAIAELHA